MNRGTAGRYRNLNAEIGRPSAGKTGTTELFVVAWYIGYVPQLATSVWVGYPQERVPMINVRGFPEINDENFPLDIWSFYIQEIAKDLPVQQLDTPGPAIKLQVKTDGCTSGKSKSAGETTSKTKEATIPLKSSSGQLGQSRQSEQPQRSPPPSNQPQQPPSVYRPLPIYSQPVPYDDPTYGQ